MKSALILATALSLTVTAAIAQTFETVDESPPGDHFDPSANVDILGLRPGDTIEDVKAKLKAEFPDQGEPEERRLKSWAATPEGARVDIEFVNQVQLGGVSVYFASEVYDNRALAIERSLRFDQFTTADVFRKQVAEKYGRPSIVDESGNEPTLYYIYANGRLLSEADAPKPKENCDRINDNCDHVEIQKSPETGMDARVSQKPCAAFFFAGEWEILGRYKVGQHTPVIDDQCDGIMQVSMGRSTTGGLSSAGFTFVDVRRAYGHQVALDAAIEAKLMEGVDMDKVAKPKL
ncbi:hypothetical protein NJB93_20770 [Brucella intermedia]|uniref:hypothetical protein n=1 Tax=Brucella intermedia TaxID=94625 RepID=UPI00209B586F|nr:hypothetical protein [Brucella intermedia]MCO7728997.1 hypothetical protein [Brucella intermedia]